MSTIKVDTVTTLDGTGNITLSRPLTGLSGSGASLTALNATELTSGTLPMARLSGTLPALNGSALTALPAANLTGTIAAISGANLTNLNATNLASGTVPTARLGSGTANNGVFLRGDGSWQTAGSTSASDLTSGTLPMARLSGTLPALNGSALTNLPASALSPMFYVYDENADISITSSTWTKVTFPDTLFDPDNVFDSSTNHRFTVPSGQAGKYVLSSRISVYSSSNNITDCRIKIYKNGSFYHGGYLFAYSTNIRHIAPHLNFIEDASAGDYYEVYIFINATSPKIYADSENKKFQFFCGYKIG